MLLKNLAIDRAKELFGAAYLCKRTASLRLTSPILQAYLALIEPGDTGDGHGSIRRWAFDPGALQSILVGKPITLLAMAYRTQRLK